MNFDDFDNREIIINCSENGFILKYLEPINDSEEYKYKTKVYKKEEKKDLEEMVYDIIDYLEFDYNCYVYTFKVKNAKKD